MADADRTASRLLEARQALEQEPYRFGFYAAVRLLECLHRDKPRIGRSARATDDPVRLAQEPSLAFAPSTLSSFEPGRSGTPKLTVRFLGMFGPNGPLPLHLTEYARDRLRNSDDPTFIAFLDVFHHRMLSLFYRAWADTRPTVSFDRPRDDHFGAAVGSTFGLGMTSLRERDSVPDTAKLCFAGRLAAGARNAEGLLAILSDYFEVPASVEPFAGAWLRIPRSAWSRLGGGRDTCALGESAILGSSVWDCQHRFRIRLGRMGLARFLGLLPGGASLRRLVDWVRLYAGLELRWDLVLVLDRREVPEIRLGRAGRLGWTTWFAGVPFAEDPDDVRFEPALYAAIRPRRGAGPMTTVPPKTVRLPRADKTTRTQHG